MSSRIRFSSTSAAHSYNVIAAALLQRNPIVMRPLTEIEKEYSKYRQNLEVERSRGTFNIGSSSIKSNSTVTVNEAHVPEQVEVNDELGSKELSRKLHRKLYLCLKDETGQWTLPMTKFNLQEDKESGLHSKSHNLLKDLLAPSVGLQLYHLGAAPVAFHLEKYSDRVVAPLGAKMFFFRSQLVAGRVRLQTSEKISDYGWFCREEMEEIFSKDLFESIKPVITD